VRKRRVSHSHAPASRQTTASAGHGERNESKTGIITPRASIATSTSSLSKSGGKKDGLLHSSSAKLVRPEVTTSGSNAKSRTRKASSTSLTHSSSHVTSSSSSSSTSPNQKMSASGAMPKKRVKSSECAKCTTPAFVQRLPALILQTGIFSFLLAATILLRASNPNSVLYPSYFIATQAHRKGNTNGQTNSTPGAPPTAKAKSSALYSPEELLGLAMMASFASVVAQCVSFIYAHIDQRKKHWSNHFAAPTSPFLREHLIPFLCLISGHILMLIAGHLFTAIVSVFNTPNNKLYLVSPNTYVLYVVFCSIGCHLLAKRQAAANE